MSGTIRATGAGETGRREQAKAERRQRIIGAARDLIRETGDTNLSMRTLAERAEVSLSTPYNLFGSKRAVVLAVLEDERDFAERFRRLEVKSSVERLFAAHHLAYSYYTGDPALYRALWRALLNTNGDDDLGFATPERLAQTRAIWLNLVQAAADDGYLRRDIAMDHVLQTMAYITGGTLLSWAMGSIDTKRLSPTVALGYALCLKGAAAPKGIGVLDEFIAKFQSELDAIGPGLSDRAPETL